MPDPIFPLDPDDSATDFAETCVFYATRLANTALSRIHVNKQLVNLKTDSTNEAAVARLHYTQDVNRVLADFAWPFATRYADLTLLAGTALVPVNGDWQYSYRVPADLHVARRLVPWSGKGRTYDLAPLTFKMGSDADGPLLYTNVPNTDVPLSLEYSIRPDCPARLGNPAFRSAAAWLLGSSLAGPLARSETLVTFCLTAYLREIAIAKANAGNEQQLEPEGDPGWISGR